MDLIDVIQKRKTNFNFTDQPVDPKIVKEICQLVYDNVPSKQRLFPYSIDVLDMSDVELRNMLFAKTHRNLDMSVEIDRGNPQALAPVLFVISKREPTTLDGHVAEVQQVYKNIGNRPINNIEIGMVASWITLVAENFGLSTGLCNCIRDREELLETYGKDIVLVIGVGYPSDEIEYYDPRIDGMKRIPFVDNPYPKPPFEHVFDIRIKE